jgi:hypothetical protein
MTARPRRRTSITPAVSATHAPDASNAARRELRTSRSPSAPNAPGHIRYAPQLTSASAGVISKQRATWPQSCSYVKPRIGLYGSGSGLNGA